MCRTTSNVGKAPAGSEHLLLLSVGAVYYTPMPTVHAEAAKPAPRPPLADTRALIEKLGGPDKILQVSACSSRLRLRIAPGATIDQAGLLASGVRSIAVLKDSVHLVVGPSAEALSDEVQRALSQAKA